MQVDFPVPDWAVKVMSDLTDMERNPHPVDAAKVKKFTVDLPDDAYFEYAFVDAEGNVKRDPVNEVKADNPWHPAASAVHGPGYKPDAYANPESEAKGRVSRHRIQSEILGQTRRLTLYTPQGYETTDLPVIYVQDGTAYYRIARLADVLESLLEDALVRPAHLVFLEPIDRSAEYRFNLEYRHFVLEEALPLVEKEVATTGERVAMGASLGGLVSATLALEHPDKFGTVVTQSGAFLGSPEDLDFYRGASSWVLKTLQRKEPLNLRWYLDVGTLEWLTDINRQVRDALEAKGYDYAYEERSAGHNWTNWRNGLAQALRFALEV